MAIIIPSKNIYDVTNVKIRDNVIERIEVNAFEAKAEKNSNNIVYSNFFTEGVEKGDESETEQFSKIVGKDKYYYANVKIIPYYINIPKIKIPILQSDKKVESLLLGVDGNNGSQIYYSISGIIKSGDARGTVSIDTETLTEEFHTTKYEEVTVFSLGKEELTIFDNTYADVNDIFSLSLTIEDETNLADISSAEKITEDGIDYFVIKNLSVLCGIEKRNLHGSAEDPEEGVIFVRGDYSYYEPQQVEINVYGVTVGIKLHKKTVYVNGETSKKVFSIDGNELMQITNKIKSKRTNAIQELFSSTQQQYQNGKETATIRCSIGDYYEYESGDKIISVDNSTSKMSFSIGDQVVPMVYGANKQDTPMSKSNNKAKIFEVLGTKIFYDGAVWQELSLQETTDTIELPEEQVQLITPVVTISGDILTISNVDANTEIYILYVNNEVTRIFYGEKFDLSTLSLSDGAYSISVVAKSENYKDSEKSIDAIYIVESVVERLQAPVISISGDILTITTEDDRTEQFVILVDGEETAVVDGKEEEPDTPPEEPDTPNIPNTPTEGLKYTLSTDGTYYICKGIGTATDTDIVIASEYNGLPVTTIGESAFRGKTNITSVSILRGVTSIDDDAFRECSNLTSVTIPNSVTSIGERAFLYCHLMNLYITDIAAWCNVSFGSIVSSPLNSVENLYVNNQLVTDLVIPDGVTSIGDRAFASFNGLKSVVIGDRVTSIGYGAFNYCDGLTSVDIPDSVTSIGDYAFYNCDSLTSVLIGNTVTSIGEYAFNHCDKLSSITFNGTKEQFSKISRGFSWVPDLYTRFYVYCTDGTVSI